MKKRHLLSTGVATMWALLLVVGLAAAQAPQAALGTAFTYQGQLRMDGGPVNDTCDFRFSLWDAASGGAQVGTTQTKTGVAVSNGLFTIPNLDFGSVFTGDARWLAVAVRCPAGSGSYTNLSPRQALTATPYALGLRPGAFIQGSVGLGGVVSADNTSTGLLGSGLWGTSAGGIGVYGKTTATSGTTSGVWGESVSPEGRGVSGYANATSGAAYGVYGESDSTDGRGVVGVAGASSGPTFGVYGRSDSTEGYGVSGYATAASGTTYGVYGESASPAGVGVYGRNTSSGTGTAGTSNTGDGMRGQSSGAQKSGVYGVNTHSAGFGVYGRNSGTGNVGYLGGAYGVYGESASTGGTGVLGTSHSDSGRGVVGWVAVISGVTFGVYGYCASPSGYAGYFSGNVHVTDDFSVNGTKSFKIDHPLDPANRYLYHFAQEAPEVQNIYNGVATLDAQGEATVTLPAYFSALNTGPFRYQLTAIGAPMPSLHIAQEIQGNTFRIAGGVPGKKVSWEVTAVRNDPYLRDHPAQAEIDKPADEQGTYLYPEGYGQPAEMGLDYQRNRHLLERPEIAARPAGDGE